MFIKCIQSITLLLFKLFKIFVVEENKNKKLLFIIIPLILLAIAGTLFFTARKTRQDDAKAKDRFMNSLMQDEVLMTVQLPNGDVSYAKIKQGIVESGELSQDALLEVEKKIGEKVEEEVHEQVEENQKEDKKTMEEFRIELDEQKKLITNWKLQDNTTTTAKPIDSAVTLVKLEDGSVTEVKIADGAVTEGKIANGSIKAIHLDTGDVIDAIIKDGVITSVKIADKSVTSEKLADDSVTEDKLADDSVTGDKLADGSVTEGKLGDGSVTEDKLADGSVTTNKIDDLSIVAAKIALGTITGDQVASDGSIVKSIVGNSLVEVQDNLNGTYRVGLTAACATDEVIKYNGTDWECTKLEMGDVENLSNLESNVLSIVKPRGQYEEKRGTTPGLPSGFRSSASTFSGWGYTIGEPQDFNTIEFYINAYDPANIPTKIRVVLREETDNGVVLADATRDLVNVIPGATQETVVKITFPEVIVNPEQKEIYMQFMTDGYATFRQSTEKSNYPDQKYAILPSLTNFPSIIATPKNVPKPYIFVRFSRIFNPLETENVPKSFKYTTSTFSGWGTPIGKRNKFNVVKLTLKWFDDSVPAPTEVNIRIKDTNYSGAVLAEKKIELSGFRFNEEKELDIHLGQIVNTENNLWFEWLTDSRVASKYLTTNLYGDEYGRARYTTKRDPHSTLEGPSTSQANIAVDTILRKDETAADVTEERYRADLSDFVKSVMSEQQAEEENDNNVIEHSMPATIYAAEGRELNIYYDNFLRSDFPLDLYRYVVTCGKGDNEGDKWVFTPTAEDAGTLPWKLEIFYRDSLVKTINTNIVIKALTVGDGVTRKIVTIGDSTTAGGKWLLELSNLFETDVMHIETVGSITSTGNDAEGNPQTVKHDAVSGKSIEWYYTNASSPFVKEGVFNFAQYLSDNSITLNDNDYVLIHLGINDVFGFKTNDALLAKIATMNIQLTAMINNIRATVPNIRIGLMMTIPASSGQHGFAANYHSSQTGYRYGINRSIWVKNMLDTYKAMPNVYLVPVHLNLDTVNNFPTVTVPVNARNPKTVTKISNGVHPSSYGYWQMADSVFMFLKGQE